MQRMIFERRDATRERSLLGASISTAPNASTTECLVRDIGPGGARIMVSDAVPLPEMFDLTLHARREVRRSRLIWRRSDAVGVAFVQPRPAAVPVPLELMRELRAARAETAALRLRLADLQEKSDRQREPAGTHP
ncbi:PilZ domain-containing protein [Methylobacterium sp. BTF04]|uniref:PilZ domain-containing protein n=1 Tax=Methylobacterium sp. BTF04 TaxID=2708300 RepID=UPI0013D42DB2|nr:PilZ domain-containing protein [Methylobacterium sp. BTF04]NEU14134.1 PilZ domain-containing protein [Methylobacterium sp. BTF04]